MLDESTMELDHDDDDPTIYRGYSHKSCNARAGALKLIRAKEAAYRASKGLPPRGTEKGSPLCLTDPKPASLNGSIREEGWWIQQRRCTGEERNRLLREWERAIERWHEAMREAIRLDDGAGNYDAPVKAASDEWDAAWDAYNEAVGVRITDGRKQNWNGKDWVDVGPEPWW
jgi:hypothetical protein